MSKRFTESEMLAYTKNRHEEKALQTRIRQLTDQLEEVQDNSKREKNDMMDHFRNFVKTSGSCPQPYFVIENGQHETLYQNFFINIRRMKQPWAYSINNDTFNAVYRDALLTEGTGQRLRRSKSVTSQRTSSEGRSLCSVSQTSARFSTGLRRAKTDSELVRLVDTRRRGNRVICEKKKIDECTELKNLKIEQSQLSINGDSCVTTRKIDLQDRQPVDSEVFQLNLDEKSNLKSAQSRERKLSSNLPPLPETIGEDSSQVGKPRFVSTKSKLSFPRETDLKEGKANNTIIKKDFANQMSRQEVNLREKTPVSIEINGLIEIKSISQEMDLPKTSEIKEEKAHHSTSLKAPSLKNEQRIHTDLSVKERPLEVLSEPQLRPHTVATMEALDPAQLNGIEGIDSKGCVLYKGRILKNYIRPQHRYKLDPRLMRRKQVSMETLAKLSHTFVRGINHANKHLEIAFPRPARQRLLVELVKKNNAGKGLIASDPNSALLQTKIKAFMNSITK
ncbi:hypothetical protein CHS0354_039573 [Potamilus streckersoni]|uniref:Uncharacterized protein n=1 Tax=Potamilus streckersoni TaxID=2493646 RepID=A0AAE0SUX5_9BIVA|nr:hypothetical protein CHS0354_039573 [Potamilus streckersoni]